MLLVFKRGEMYLFCSSYRDSVIDLGIFFAVRLGLLRLVLAFARLRSGGLSSNYFGGTNETG